jgi:hypothetical protein
LSIINGLPIMMLLSIIKGLPRIIGLSFGKRYNMI